MKKNKKPHSLRAFMLISIGISVMSCIVVISVIFLNNMSEMLRQAEREHMNELSRVIKSSLNTTFHNLHSSTRTWSSWDELYDYVIGENDSFTEENLDDGTMLALYQADFAIIKDLDGNVIYSVSRSEIDGVMRMEVPAGLEDDISEIAAAVLAGQPPEQVYSPEGPYCDVGFLVSEGQSYMIGVLPIIHSDETGPPVGTFTFAVIFGNEQLIELTQLDNTSFYIYEPDGSDITAFDVSEIKGPNSISMNTLIPNMWSGRDTVMTFDHQRALYVNGWSLVMTTMVLLYTAIILIMAVLVLIIYRYLLRPLSGLISDLSGVDQDIEIDTDKYSQYYELNTLSHAINGMLERVEQSYLATEKSKVSVTILENILNGMDAYLYVSDTVTDEILFINNEMKHHFGLPDDGIGNTCWKVLQSGFEQRCEFCPCHKLDKDPTTPVVWEEHNTVTNRYYRNTDRYIDWIGGRKAHLQHSVDITDLKMAQFAVDRRLAQQSLMTAISQSFLSGADMDILVTNALRMAGDFMGISQILFYKLEDDGITLTCKNEWMAQGMDAKSQIGSKLLLDGPLLSLKNSLSDENDFYLCSNDAVTKEAVAQYRSNFHNYIITPTFLKNKVGGTLDFSKEDDGKPWSESDISLATLLSSLLSGVFDRHFMENQLRRISSIVESSSQFILYLTSDGKVDYVNPAAVTITGFTETEFEERGLDIIFDEKTVCDIKEKHIPTTLREGADSFEIDLVCKDGGKRIMAFSSFTTGTDSVNIGAIANDVTDIRALEYELIAAKEQAEQGSHSKSEFLSRMSHEMRTPMNAIIGMTSIAKSSDDSAKKEYCLDRIDNASRHLLGVINDILDMSKIEANKFDLSYSEFNFDRMLLNVINVINFRLDEKQQSLSLDIDPGIPAAIIGDEQRLAQVITNLLTNAVKFTPENCVIALKARVLESKDGALTIQIDVIDSGIGISREQQSRLFHSFEQADGSIARKFGGTGLGLAISKRIIELMGGEIWVESELEKGSTFTFTFKASTGKGTAVEALKNQISIGDLNIMAVDDSTEARDYIGHVMNKIGASCVLASSGTEALELFKSSQKPFDILFIDWKMPVMNGIELTKELRKLPGKQPIIIMISVAEWNEIEREANQAGIDDFIPKPVFPSLLIDCINKHLNSATADNSEDKSNPTQSFEGKALLLAEDIDINREIITTVLEDSKLVIDCAENGKQAVEMFTANPEKYDLIFMDVHMPEVDGLEATRRIRALPVSEGKTVPIVAMTANVFREDIEKCLAAGMNDHIGKPIDFDMLFIKLKQYLGTGDSL